MLAASTAFNEAFKSDLREVKMWIKINDVAYTDEDIVSFNFTSGSITGDSFAIGSTFANSVKLTLCKVVEGLKVFDTVLPEMGIILEDGSVEYVKLGTFLITEEVNPDRNENRTSIECTDQMITLDDPYISKLKYPAKIRDVALEIANLAGVKVDPVSFGRLMDNTIREPKGYSFREAIGLIAQFEAGYATFDRNGLLAVKTLYDPQYKITPDEYFLKGLVKNELVFRPAGIEVKIGDDETKNLSIGNKKGSVIHLENKVMTERLLRLVYEKIRNINYYPYSLNWRGNPAIEAGDWLYIKDTKGNEYKLPNLNYTMEYKGGLTAISTVETVASNDVKFKYRKILDQAIEYVNNSIKDIDGSMNYYGAEDPSNPKNGDIWFKYVGSDTEIWIYQKVGEPDKFEWVLQISSAVDESIKEKIEELEKESKENQEKVDTSLLEAEKAREQAELARKEAFDSGVIAKQAEKDSLNAIAQGDQNQAEITKLDDSIKLQATNVEGNTAKIAKLQIENDKVSSTVSKTQADLENMSIGGRNLQKGTSKEWTELEFSGWNGYIYPLIQGDFKKGQEIVISSILNPLTNPHYIKLICWDKEGNGITEYGNSETVQVGQEKLVFYKLKLSKDAKTLGFSIRNIASNLNSKVRYKEVKVELGNVRTDWSPAPEDFTTLTEFSSFVQTSQGFQQSVNNDIAGVKSQQTQMAGQISSIVKDVELTADRVDDSKILAMTSQGKNLSKDPLFQKGSNGLYAYDNSSSGNLSAFVLDNSNGSHPTVKESKNVFHIKVTGQVKPGFGGIYKLIDGSQNSMYVVKFSATLPVGRRFEINHNSLGTGGFVKWLTDNKGVGSWQEYAYLIKYGTGSLGLSGHLYVEGGSVPTPQSPLLWSINKYEDIEITSSSQTQITQLQDQIDLNVKKTETVDGRVTQQQGQINVMSNNISLKVDKDKAVAQINLSPETIRLDAKRIHLAGASLIDNAVIKEAMIADAAITNAKIQNATISDAKIISINANKINAITLSAITTNTGQLNVTGWLDFQTENRGLRGSFNFYDVPDESYYSRWYDGELRLSHRHMILTSNIYNVNANSTRGGFKYYSETMYGPDYVKLRQYKNDKKSILSRVDIRADAIEIGQDWSFAKSIILKNNGSATFGGKVDFNGGVDISLGLRVGRIEAPMNYQSFVINEGRNLGTMIFSHDGQRYIRSMDIYDRTYNSQPQVCITDAGTLGRIVSARKYKTEIWTAYDLIDKAKNVLSIQPKSWVDKMKPEGQRHYGFIADEFEESNLREVVLYGSNGDVEGLSYDRITTYHNVILSEHEREIQELKTKIKRLEEGMLNGIVA